MECLSDDRLLAFVQGELPLPEREIIESHVDGCRSCFRLVGAAMRLAPVAPPSVSEELDDGPQTADFLDLPTTIGGRYEVRELIGQGGAGAVYRAFDVQLKRAIAFKIVRAPRSKPGGVESMQARLLREARAMAQISHPHVVTVYDVGSIEDRVFIVMELVDGRTLAQWTDEPHRSWRDIVSTFIQAGRGLAAAHVVGLVHRDFKPLNVLVGTDGRVRVTDFGLARPARAEDAVGSIPPTATTSKGRSEWTLTRTHGLIGTPAFMAPEQFAGETVDARSDQFSFCVALFSALYGIHPFAPEGPDRPPVAELAMRVVAGQVRQPPEDKRIPPAIFEILRRGLDPNPDRRHLTMDALIRELDLELERTKERPITRRVVWAAGAVVLSAAAIAALWIRHDAPASQSTQTSSSTAPSPSTAHEVATVEPPPAPQLALPAESASPSSPNAAGVAKKRRRIPTPAPATRKDSKQYDDSLRNPF
jgi:serine/threonine protein kinase